MSAIHPETAAPPPRAPSIGRIVLYSPTDGERCGRGGAEVYPAVITRVWSPTCVNLHVLPDAADPSFAVTSRTLGDLPGEWRWPPRV